MTIRYVGLFLIGSLAACGSPADKTDNAAPPPIVQADSEAAPSSEPAATPAVDAPTSTEATCDTPDENSVSAAKCIISPSDGSGLVLEVRYGGSDPEIFESPTILSVTTQDGTIVQTISESTETFHFSPTMQDLDLDGRADLLVPLETGNVNTVFALWHGQDADTPFTRLGELSGVGVDIGADGLFSMPARSSVATWDDTYYKIEDNTLVEIAIKSVEYSEDGSIYACAITDAGSLSLIGLTAEDAQTRFCGAE
ncbi:MAG: hypothetical protein ABJG15_06055 [Hyphomonadaceae bacterium]